MFVVDLIVGVCVGCGLTCFVFVVVVSLVWFGGEFALVCFILLLLLAMFLVWFSLFCFCFGVVWVGLLVWLVWLCFVGFGLVVDGILV